MKKLLLIALSTVAISGLATSANAWEPSFYTGANAASWQYKQSDLPSNFNIITLEGLAGITVFPYLAVEARVGAGITTGRETVWFLNENDEEEGITFEVDARHFASLYFRPQITNEKASLYGLLGITTIDLDSDTGGSTSDTNASFGVGVSFVMNPAVSITAEWRKLINADNFNLRGGSVGFTYSF